MLHRTTTVTLILYLCLICVGCSSKNIQDNQTTPVVYLATPIIGENPLSNQTLEIRNCDGKSELHRSLAGETQVISNITIAEEATIGTSGNTLELSEEMKANLTGQVQRAYQQIYEDAKAKVEETSMAVPVGKVRLFTIYWKQNTYSSTISFTMDHEVYTTSYTYTLDIPDASISSEISCTG